MPIQQSTAGATNGNLTRNETAYMQGVLETRTYDQLASPVGKTFEPRGLTVAKFWLTDALPRPTGAVGVEQTDFEPQTIRDITDTFNKVFIADGIKPHELVFLKNSLLKESDFSKAVGQLASETIDGYARRAATEANLVTYGGSTQISARANLDLGTAGHNFGVSNFTIARSIMGSLSADDNLMVIVDDFQYADLMSTASTLFTNVLVYQDKAKLYNYEAGDFMGVRIVKSPWAKAFYGGGLANAAPVATTIATSTTANRAGDTTIEVAANTNMAVGMWLTIGTVQTSTESDACVQTEIARVSTIAATTITIVGKGRRNGLKYDHSVGATVTNADTVHAAIFGSPNSMSVDFEGYGRFGKLITPFVSGNAEQWKTFSFKYYGGYKVFEQGHILRAETSASMQ
jgi:hypothetical protein